MLLPQLLPPLWLLLLLLSSAAAAVAAAPWSIPVLVIPETLMLLIRGGECFAHPYRRSPQA